MGGVCARNPQSLSQRREGLLCTFSYPELCQIIVQLRRQVFALPRLAQDQFGGQGLQLSLLHSVRTGSLQADRDSIDPIRPRVPVTAAPST